MRVDMTLGEKEAAKNALHRVLENPNEFARCHVLNTIDCIEEKSPEMVEGVVNMIEKSPQMTSNR